jgi:phage terminase Nu1 subunit (DNA packaging protein)
VTDSSILDGGMRQPLDDELAKLIDLYPQLTNDDRKLIQDVVRRFVRTRCSSRVTSIFMSVPANAR